VVSPSCWAFIDRVGNRRGIRDPGCLDYPFALAIVIFPRDDGERISPALLIKVPQVGGQPSADLCRF
jgi:hypothetical protein